MKKSLKGTLLLLGALLALGKGEVFAKDAKVWMEDLEISIPQRWIVEDGHVLVPLRALCEQIGYDVSWDEGARQVRLKKDFRDTVYTIGKNGISVNNMKRNVDIAPKIIDDRTYISEEAFNKGLANQICWDESNDTISVQCKGVSYFSESDWLDIVDLKKTYTREDENGNVMAKIDITVPQILNYDNNITLEKINDYYKDKASKMYDEYMKLMEDDLVHYVDNDRIYEYAYVYEVIQNSDNILSVMNGSWSKDSSFIVECDVFNTLTGEKLSVYDVLDGTKEEIDKMVVDGIKEAVKGNNTAKVKDFNGDMSNVEFCLDRGDAVFSLNPGGDIVRFRIKLDDNEDLFKIKAGDPFNYDEELAAKKVAINLCDKYTKFVEKTTLGTDECYVFEKYDNSDGERIAINRSGERVYKLKKKDGMYYAMSKRRVKDEVSDRDALKLVRDRIKNSKYTTKVYGKMKNNLDGQEYSIINVKNLEGTVNKKFAVSRKDGAVYIEKKKVKPTLEKNDDGTLSAVGFLEIDTELTSRETDIEVWGSGFRTYGSYMLIQEDGTGAYNIGVSGEVEHFKLVNEDGKTYIEITNEEGKEALQKGTRFLVEVKEIDGVSYLYVHDEEGRDSKPGNKYWRLNLDNRSIYIDKDAIVPVLKTEYDAISAAGCFRINDYVTSKETDTSVWGTGYAESGSCMIIGNDRTGTYSIGGSSNIEHFKLVEDNGKTYMEITNEDGEGGLSKGTRFLVEVREVDGVPYLYVHDEDGKDFKPGNKYWELYEEDAMRFEPYGYHNKI